MEGTKIFKSVYYMTESTRKCQKAKKIGTEISILGDFVALSKLFFTILSCELSFVCLIFRTKSKKLKTCLDKTLPVLPHTTTVLLKKFEYDPQILPYCIPLN